MKRETKMLRTTGATILILLIAGLTSLELSKSRPIIIPVQKNRLITVLLKSASSFVVLAGSSLTNTGKTILEGELGLSPGLWVDGFPKDRLVLTQQNNFSKSTQAKLDLDNAYNDAKGRRSKEVVRLNGNIGGLVLTPGLYNSDSSLEISSGNLTFDAMGNRKAVFIIQIASSLITRPDTKVILKRGAQASNIFWQVGGTATFGSCSVFKGTVMAFNSIKFYDGAILEGRVFSRTGKVDLACNKIVKL